MRKLEKALCGFCNQYDEVVEGDNGRICRRCLGKAMGMFMHASSREPKTEGDQQARTETQA